jgi:hypothetical protein
MTTYDTAEVEGTAVEPHTRRACEEPMVVVPHGETSGMFDIYTGTCDEEDGQPYTVDLGGAHDRCSCPDMEYNLKDGERCKHARRVRLEFGLPPFEDVPRVRSEHAAPMDVELARCRRGIDQVEEPEPSEPVGAVTVADAKPSRVVATDGGQVLESGPERAAETSASGAEEPAAADRDVRLEANRIATEAVANADGPLTDFDVFCLTVEATQDILLRTLKE